MFTRYVEYLVHIELLWGNVIIKMRILPWHVIRLGKLFLVRMELNFKPRRNVSSGSRIHVASDREVKVMAWPSRKLPF